MSLRRIPTTAAALALAVVPLGARVRPTNPPKFPEPATKFATKYTIDQFLSPSSPLEVGAAKRLGVLRFPANSVDGVGQSEVAEVGIDEGAIEVLARDSAGNPYGG